MTMLGPWSPAALSAAEQHGVRELVLNYAKGWRGTYEHLRDLPALLSLDIIDWGTTEIGAIHALRGLRRLGISTYCSSEIDFACFPDLRECALEWRPKARSIFAHTRLEKVFINKLPVEDLRAFGQMRLASLSLASPRLERLAGIEALTDLRFLGVYVARRLSSLDGLQHLPRLNHLEINTCRKIGDISALSGGFTLEHVHLCNDGDIASLAPLASHTGLRTVLFYESTNIVDGNLRVLTSLPRLENVAFMNRRHYSHRREDFPAWFGAAPPRS